jgi:hypothetical protein
MTARPTQNCFAKFGLSDSIESINFRAHKSVAAKRIARFRCSSMTSPGFEFFFPAEEGTPVCRESRPNVRHLPYH